MACWRARGGSGFVYFGTSLSVLVTELSVSEIVSLLKSELADCFLSTFVMNDDTSVCPKTCGFPSLTKQLFSHVGTEPLLPVYYQYFSGNKCILLKDTTQRR